MENKELKDRLKKIKRYGIITGCVYLFVIPFTLILTFITLFTDNNYETLTNIGNMVMNLTTVLFMGYSSVFIADNGGWGKNKQLKLLKYPFFIMLIFNMCFLAFHLLKLI